MRTKVLFITYNLARGGAERVLSNLLNHTNKDKFELLLATFDSKVSYSIPSYVKVYNLQAHTFSGIKSLINYPIKIYKLSRLINAERPDIAFSFLFRNNILIVLTSIFLNYCPKIVISERINLQAYLRYSGIDDKILALFVPLLYRRADTIVTVSKGVKKDLVSNFRGLEDKVSVIYNGVDERAEDSTTILLEHSWFRESTPIIISIGRLDKQKDYVTALKAFSIVR